jgi:hypothetical protein
VTIRSILALAAALAASSLSSVLPESIPAAWTLETDADLSIGASKVNTRPLLPQTSRSVSVGTSWEGPTWVYFQGGISAFAFDESVPDPSLFLYRGFGGWELAATTGPRFGFGGWVPSSLGLEGALLAGLGLAAMGDTGTTLVSMSPFVTGELRLLGRIGTSMRWMTRLPIEAIYRGGTWTGSAGLGIGLSWSPSAKKSR